MPEQAMSPEQYYSKFPLNEAELAAEKEYRRKAREAQELRTNQAIELSREVEEACRLLAAEIGTDALHSLGGIEITGVNLAEVYCVSVRNLARAIIAQLREEGKNGR